MINDLPLERSPVIYKKRRRLERHARIRARRRHILCLIISLGLIIISLLSITYNMYIRSNSKDLSFAVEHNFTTGFSAENKLLRIQKMSLIYFDGENAIVEASGLTKAFPHKSTCIRASFKKDSSNSWYLEKFMSSY